MARSPANFRAAELTRALRATLAAGVKVARIELERGRIVLLVGEGSAPATSSAAAEDLDRELAEFEARHGEG